MPLIFFGTITIDPASGTEGGSVNIDNTGAGFFDTMIVTIGGIPADNISVDTGYGNGQQRIACDIPAGLTPGDTVDVYVENPDGENATLTGGFEVEVLASGAESHIAVFVGSGVM